MCVCVCVGRALRPKDSLPVPGSHPRAAAVKTLQAFAKQVNGTRPDLDSLLPPSLFACTGDTGAARLTTAECRLLCLRWSTVGFCKQWVWQQVADFLTRWGYQPIPGTAHDLVFRVGKLVEELGWARSKQAKLCGLYIIGKAKSL